MTDDEHAPTSTSTSTPTPERQQTRDRGTLRAVDHTHPHTGEPFGATRAYERGRPVAADGGAREPDAEAGSEHEGDPESEAESGPGIEAGHGTGPDSDTLADVDHTPPKNAQSTQRAFERSDESDEESV